jgi:hypothetical protein
MRRLQACLTLILGLLLVGCEAQATPVAGGFVTATPSLVPTNPTPLRYALTASVPLFGLNTNELLASGLVDQLTTADGEGYDIVIALETRQDWETAPNPLTIGLALNPNLAPLNNEALLNLVRQSISPVEIAQGTAWKPLVNENSPTATIRANLTSLGLPDGISLMLGTRFEATTPPLTAMFSARNVELNSITLSSEVHNNALSNNLVNLLVVLWVGDEQRTVWENQVGADNLIALFTVDISYRLGDGVQVVGYTSQGLPLIERQ